jgi:deoxyribose-phosphate aldolase
MTDTSPAVRPPLAAYEDLARMAEYAVLDPDFTEESVHQASLVARKYRVGRFTVRPADLDLVTQWMKGTGISVGTVVSYPHASDTTAAKLYAVRDALGRGAKAIETPLNLGKVVSRQFRYVESELMQMAQECRHSGAELIVDFELSRLAEDLRVIVCRIARRADVHWVRAGCLHGSSCAWEDLPFLASKLGDAVRLDAGPMVATLEDAQRAYEIGSGGFLTTDPAPLLESWTAELQRREEEARATTNNASGESNEAG